MVRVGRDNHRRRLGHLRANVCRHTPGVLRGLSMGVHRRYRCGKGARTQRLRSSAKADRTSSKTRGLKGVTTRLVREWQGRTYEVLVLDGAFSWQGTSYRSLSAVARKITGTSWSGPLFFGLKPNRGAALWSSSGPNPAGEAGNAAG